MDKKRIQVYADPETKRRIELAAARRNMPVTEYCLEAIKEYLADDDMLEREKIEIPVRPARDGKILTNLRNLRDRITARRGGKLITTDIVGQVRGERDDELLCLC